MEGVVVPAVKRVPNPRSVPQCPNTEEKLKVYWKMEVFREAFIYVLADFVR